MIIMALPLMNNNNNNLLYFYYYSTGYINKKKNIIIFIIIINNLNHQESKIKKTPSDSSLQDLNQRQSRQRSV